MISTIRQHTWTGLVAAATLTAVLAEGLFEPLGYAAAAVLVWSVVAVCLVGRVFDLAPIGRLAVIAGLLLGAITVLVLLSTLWAKDQGRAFEEGVRAALYLGLFTLAACTAREDARRRWIAGLATGLAIAGGIALFAYLQPGILDSGRSEIPNAAGRLSYPIGYWNGAASMLAVAAVLLAFCAANAATRLMRSLATAAIPPTVVGIWLTSSRGGLIALGLGWAVMLAVTRTRVRLLKVILLGGVVGVVLILIGRQLDALTSGALDAARRSDGDRMSAFVIAGTLLTGAVAWALDGRVPRVRISRRAGDRAARDPAPHLRHCSCPDRTREEDPRLHRRSGSERPGADSRRELQRPLAVLEVRRQRIRELSGSRPGRRRMGGLLGGAQHDPSVRAKPSFAAPAERCRARDTWDRLVARLRGR